MKAALLIGKETVDIRKIPEPTIHEPTDVLVEVDALSVCMTDFEIIRGEMKTKKLPIVLGHEGSGKVVSKGTKVTNVAKGDRVLIDPNVSDLTCPSCIRGFSNLCENGGLMGREVDGVFRERLVLSSRNVYRLPSEIPIGTSPLIQPLSTVIHALKRVEIAPGDTVLVLGLGVTGLMFAQLAKLRGARVFAASGIPQRLDLGKHLGVDYVINKTETSFGSAVKKATGGAGVDVVIDSTGYQGLLQREGMEIVKPHGTILLYAAKEGELRLNSYDAYHREITFKTSRSSLPRDFEEAIRLVEQGKLDLSYQISRSFSFDKISDAITFFEDRVEVLKAVITMS